MEYAVKGTQIVTISSKTIFVDLFFWLELFGIICTLQQRFFFFFFFFVFFCIFNFFFFFFFFFFNFISVLRLLTVVVIINSKY